MSVVPVFCVLAAAVFVVAARTYEADLKLAESIEPATNDKLEPQAA